MFFISQQQAYNSEIILIESDIYGQSMGTSPLRPLTHSSHSRKKQAAVASFSCRAHTLHTATVQHRALTSCLAFISIPLSLSKLFPHYDFLSVQLQTTNKTVERQIFWIYRFKVTEGLSGGRKSSPHSKQTKTRLQDRKRAKVWVNCCQSVIYHKAFNTSQSQRDWVLEHKSESERGRWIWPPSSDLV